jgi:hypothetical protein
MGLKERLKDFDKKIVILLSKNDSVETEYPVIDKNSDLGELLSESFEINSTPKALSINLDDDKVEVCLLNDDTGDAEDCVYLEEG